MNFCFNSSYPSLAKRPKIELAKSDEVAGHSKESSNTSGANQRLPSANEELGPAERARETKQTDLKTFAKLTLSQQVQRRYEMMGKAAPTPLTLAEQRSKKVQGGSGQKASGQEASRAADGQRVPKLIVDGTNKIPLAMRQRYLTVIFENGRGTFATLEKACEKAAEQEKSIYDRAKNKVIYTNLAANLVKG